MIRFNVYDENGPAERWPLINAHLLGREDLVMRGKVAFSGGVIECRKQGPHSVALCLQHDAGPMGRLMLQTCLLPERDEPYELTVELARHRIKTFIAKSEEWQMFDLSSNHPATRHWEQARRLLTKALTAEDPLAGDTFAKEALSQAIHASERLAMAHAELLLHRRYASRAASSVTLGVRIWPRREGKALREIVSSNFDVLAVPIRWRDLEVEEGRYDWGPLDRWMEWAKGEGKPVIAGPLLDFSKYALPDWMYVWQHDYDTCRDLVYDYMTRVVDRYRGIVGMWNVASGLNLNDNFEFGANQMLDLARTASLLVRQNRKGARTMIELREPFGEHGATRDSLPLFTFVDRLIQEGIKFDALGVQILFGQRDHGQAARDLMQISSMLDRFFALETPILVSALGVPSEPIPGVKDAGFWHDEWSPDVQSRWVGRMFAIAMSKPFVESVFWSELFDHTDSRLPLSGLITAEGKPKPAFTRLVTARRRLRKPLGAMKRPEKEAEPK